MLEQLFPLPEFGPISLLQIVANGTIVSNDNISKKLRSVGFQPDSPSKIGKNAIPDYCISEFDFARILTFPTQSYHVIHKEWYKVLTVSPTGQFVLVSFLRQEDHSFTGGITRHGFKTEAHSKRYNEVTMYIHKIRGNRIEEIKNDSVLILKDNFVCMTKIPR